MGPPAAAADPGISLSNPEWKRLQVIDPADLETVYARDRLVPIIEAIEEYLIVHNADPKIFTWTKDAETILAKVQRAKAKIVTL